MDASERIKYFVFVDKINHQVLQIKKSRMADYSFQSEDFLTFELETSIAVTTADLGSIKFTPEMGFREGDSLATDDFQRAAFLKGKIDRLIQLKTNVEMVKQNIKRDYLNVERMSFPQLHRSFLAGRTFLHHEMASVLEHCDRFFSESQKRLDAGRTTQEVEESFHSICSQTNFGYYNSANGGR